jgi:hypothetical protein
MQFGPTLSILCLLGHLDRWDLLPHVPVPYGTYWDRYVYHQASLGLIQQTYRYHQASLGGTYPSVREAGRGSVNYVIKWSTSSFSFTTYNMLIGFLVNTGGATKRMRVVWGSSLGAKELRHFPSRKAHHNILMQFRNWLQIYPARRCGDSNAASRRSCLLYGVSSSLSSKPFPIFITPSSTEKDGEYP